MLTSARIGILGGTFNPFHNAHLIMARKAKAEFRLDQVVFVPAGNPPHKVNQTIIDQEHRFNMVSLAVAGDPDFSVSRIELDREGPHFAVDTFTALRASFDQSAQLYYIIGMDSLNDILTWKEPERLFGLCEFIVAGRPGSLVETFEKLAAATPFLQRERAKIHFMPLQEDVSSTQVRDLIKREQDVSAFLPQTVEDYIKRNGLYRG